MSDTTGPVADPTPPTEPLQLADQQPLTAAPAAEPVAPKKNHTRTILEVVGAVIAVLAIAAAGTIGFVAGHATSGRGDRDFSRAAANGPMGGQGFGQGQPGQQGQRGQGFGQGQQGQPGQQGQGFGQGQDPRGIDPDGDNWTGGGQGGGMMGGQQGGQGQQGQGFGQGQDPRGIDPDGDNWTGQGQGGGMRGVDPGSMMPGFGDDDGNGWGSN